MVQEPAVYRLVPGMKIADLIFRAGGTLDGTYLERGELARLVESESDSLTQTVLIGFPLHEILADPDHEENLVLSRNDKVFVRSAPGWQPPPVVTLEGEVQFPGGYGLQSRTERISEVVARAGGPTPDAFFKGAQLFRRDEGRVIIDFSKALVDPNSRDNIALEDGDSVYVPHRPETVRVSGAVGIPGLLLHARGKKAGYYIEKAGGLTEKADAGRVKIIRVTGAAQGASRRFWADPAVHEGDEIRVAEVEEKKPIDWGKSLKEAAMIIASLATTVYVISEIGK
jgi:protein involved in polysaccharide export with SLBB domain